MDKRLTPREETVAALRCREGLTNRQVAQRLFISDQTVKSHVTAILRKHGAVAMDQVCWRLAFAEGAKWSAPAMRPELV